MDAISSWLLSIAGVVLLSIIAEFVLPDGQINKYIKTIFSFVILLVIIMPLPKLFNKDFKFDNYFSSEQTLQEDYLYQVNLDKLTSLNEGISEQIEKSGLKNVVVSIDANILSENLECYGVFVDLCDIEFLDGFGNTDIAKAKIKIAEIIKSYDILENVEVEFNELS